jgi:hypothetical protein
MEPPGTGQRSTFNAQRSKVLLLGVPDLWGTPDRTPNGFQTTTDGVLRFVEIAEVGERFFSGWVGSRVHDNSHLLSASSCWEEKRGVQLPNSAWPVAVFEQEFAENAE